MDEHMSETNETAKQLIRKMRNFNNQDSLDSDDESDEEETLDLVKRLSNVNLDDADAVWSKLNDEERQHFLEVCETGEISKMIPQFKPWWELEGQETEKKCKIPEIIQINNFGKKTFAPQLPFNLQNILAAYTVVIRVYNGEFEVSFFEAAALLINMSCVLKDDAKFESNADAINSVIIEAKTAPTNASSIYNFIQKKLLLKDMELIMSSLNSQKAVLSDAVRLMQQAKNIFEKTNEKGKNLFKAHCLSMQMKILDSKQFRKIIKKLEFFLIYVTCTEKELSVTDTKNFLQN